MRYAICLLSLLVATVGAVPPRVTSATYQLKETNLQGVQEMHSILRVDTDQALYYLNDPHCGCYANVSQCQATFLNTTVSEAGYNITALTKGQWYTFPSVPFAQVLYFKFYLQPSDSVTCPIVKIEHNLNIGDSDMAVSNAYIPSLAQFQWIKYRWFKDALWVCPQTTAWGYGWWYLAIIAELPRVEYMS